MAPNEAVSPEAWAEARRALMEKEKAHTRAGDALAAERRALPWQKIDKPYGFATEGGEATLADLFGGRSQLVVHHLMFAPEWKAGCPSCSLQAEHIDGPARHLKHRNVAVVAVSHAPLAKITAYRARMGWGFDWVSSLGSDFNYDFAVSFAKDQVAAGRIDYNFGAITTDARYLIEELPGVSVFFKDESGAVYRTYSTYARGLDALMGINHYLDLTPEGRDRSAYPGWPRRHDEYEGEGGVGCQARGQAAS